jgi:hypothetical protein
MYDLARSVGSTACHLIDGVLRSACTTNDDVTAVGFTAVTLIGAIVLMLALKHADGMI